MEYNAWILLAVVIISIILVVVTLYIRKPACAVDKKWNLKELEDGVSSLNE
jgi:hypothetical protein